MMVADFLWKLPDLLNERPIAVNFNWVVFKVNF